MSLELVLVFGIGAAAISTAVGFYQFLQDLEDEERALQSEQDLWIDRLSELGRDRPIERTASNNAQESNDHNGRTAREAQPEHDSQLDEDRARHLGARHPSGLDHGRGRAEGGAR